MQDTIQENDQAWLEKPITELVKPNPQTILLGLLLVVAIITRFYHLGERVMSHDEINHVYFGWQFFKGGNYIHDPMMHGPLQFHLLKLSYFLFNVSDFTARIPYAFFSVLTIMFIWKFHPYLGKPGALVAAVLFTVSPYMLYYGRYARNEAIAIFFTIATVWAVLRFLDTGKMRYLHYSGLFAALHFATKETYYIFTAQLLVFLGLLFICRVSQQAWQKNSCKIPFLRLLAISFVLLIALFSTLLLRPETNYSDIKSETAPGEASLEGSVLKESTPAEIGNFGETQLPVILGSLAGISFLGAFGYLLAGYRWENLKNEPSFELMLFQFLLILPQLAAFPAFWLEMKVSDFYNQESIQQITPILLIFLFAALIFGLLWKWKDWLIGAGIYYGIFVFFFTSLFTNFNGIYTGLIGSLGYWLEQHGVERGSQPKYYFTLVQLPIYEYLAVLSVLIVAIMGIIWLIKNYRAGNIKTLELHQTSPENKTAFPVQLPTESIRIITLSLLIFFSFTSVFAYSSVGEKMPWLTVHISWAMWLAAGWLFAQIIKQIHWKDVLTQRGFFALVWLCVGLISLFSGIGMFFNDKMPFQGPEPEQLANTTGFLMLVLVSIVAIISLIQTTRYWKTGQVWRFTALSMLGFLTLLTTRTAFTAAYVNFDRANEYLVYAHAARGPKEAYKQIEDLSLRMTGGTEIKIAFDNHTMYPFWWYLRDYNNRYEFGENITLDLRDYPLILVGDINYQKLEPIVRDDYFFFEYVRMVWPNQDYFDLSFYKTYLGHPESRLGMLAALFQIWLNRDFSLYGQVTGQNTSDRYWTPSQTFRLYVRKDISSQIWQYGLSTANSGLLLDDYADGYIPLVADKTFRDLGLNTPRGIAVAPDGSLYIADAGNNRILHIDQDGSVLNAVGKEGSDPGQFNQPWGVAVDAIGNVYIADTWNHRIQKFDSNLKFITSWGAYGQTEDGYAFWGPRDIAIDFEGRVFVSDTGNKRILIFDSGGRYLGEFGEGGSLPGQFEEPVGLAISPINNTIFVADTWNQRIQVFESSNSADEKYVVKNTWDIDGWYGQSLENKPYLTIDNLNNVIAADPENARILMFSSEGAFIGYFGEYAVISEAGFGIISGLDADDTGGIWVVDSAKNEIKYFILPN